MTRLRSTANDNSPLTGNQPGSRRSRKSTLVEHPRTFLRPQHPRFWTNQNSERRFDPDHPEFRGVYKPVQPSIKQDYTNRSHRDSFSGSDLSSPALLWIARWDLSGKKSLTDPQREERIAGGLRPGLVLSHPLAACPDTQLDIDAAPPEAATIAVLNGLPRSWTFRRLDGWRLLAAQSPPIGMDRACPGATHASGPGTARRHYTGSRSAHHTPALV